MYVSEKNVPLEEAALPGVALPPPPCLLRGVFNLGGKIVMVFSVRVVHVEIVESDAGLYCDSNDNILSSWTGCGCLLGSGLRSSSRLASIILIGTAATLIMPAATPMASFTLLGMFRSSRTVLNAASLFVVTGRHCTLGGIMLQ